MQFGSKTAHTRNDGSRTSVVCKSTGACPSRWCYFLYEHAVCGARSLFHYYLNSSLNQRADSRLVPLFARGLLPVLPRDAERTGKLLLLLLLSIYHVQRETPPLVMTFWCKKISSPGVVFCRVCDIFVWKRYPTWYTVCRVYATTIAVLLFKPLFEPVSYYYSTTNVL